MKHKKQIIIPQSVKEIIDFISCDICKEKIIKEPELFHFEETTIEYRQGVSYPEGGEGIAITIDICGKCFNNELIPWLKEKNADIHQEEWDTW